MQLKIDKNSKFTHKNGAPRETPVASKAENATGQTTPRPWEVQSLNHADGELWLQIGHNGWGPIAGISGDEVREPYFKPVAGMKYLATSEAEQRVNAELICRCVNNHDALLDIAKAMLVVGEHIDLSQGLRLDQIFVANFKALRAVIAAAEKE